MLSEACVRLVRGETVPEDLTFRNAGPDRKIPVGKISISLSLYGVGDDVVAGVVGTNARVVNIIVHSARNVSNEFCTDKNNGEQASTMVEARIITKEQHELIDKLNVSRITGLDGDDHDLRKSLKNEMPERLAETRVKKNNPNPKFDEVMTVSCLDARAKEGALLRLDVVQDGVDIAWPSLGGFSVPVDDIMAGHQYDLRVDYGTFKLDGKKVTQSMFVSFSARDSPNGEMATLKYAPDSSRLEVMIKGFDDTWPFDVERLMACADVYSEEAYAKVKMELSKLANGDNAIPIPPFGLLPLNDVGSGPTLAPLQENNTRDNNILQTLSKCTPVIVKVLLQDLTIDFCSTSGCVVIQVSSTTQTKAYRQQLLSSTFDKIRSKHLVVLGGNFEYRIACVWFQRFGVTARSSRWYSKILDQGKMCFTFWR